MTEGNGPTDRLVQKLRRPIYNLNMAMHREHEDTPFGRGSKKRADKARREIHDIVGAYVYATEQGVEYE